MALKWAGGASYGPVLSQTELFLLRTELEINPLLEYKGRNPTSDPGKKVLVFDINTGHTAQDVPQDKDEPATLPRVQQIHVISELSPWCTTIKNENGVTVADVCQAIWKEYTNNNVTDSEMAALPDRVRGQVQKAAFRNQQELQPANAAPWGYVNAAPPSRIRRVDWLRERIWFEGLYRSDEYAISRLGFAAPNVFIMNLAPF